MRWIIALLIVLLLVLQYQLWFDEDGVHQVETLRQQVVVQKAQNEALIKQNDQLRAEVKDLKQGADAAVERARSELGMVKKNEEYFQIVQEKNAG